MKNNYYSQVDSMLSQDQLVPENVKVQALNNIKNKIDELQMLTLDKIILDALSTIALVIEDAYHISLYRFQFTLLTNIATKELKTIEETIAFAAEAI